MSWRIRVKNLQTRSTLERHCFEHLFTQPLLESCVVLDLVDVSWCCIPVCSFALIGGLLLRRKSPWTCTVRHDSFDQFVLPHYCSRCKIQRLPGFLSICDAADIWERDSGSSLGNRDLPPRHCQSSSAVRLHPLTRSGLAGRRIHPHQAYIPTRHTDWTRRCPQRCVLRSATPAMLSVVKYARASRESEAHWQRCHCLMSFRCYAAQEPFLHEGRAATVAHQVPRSEQFGTTASWPSTDAGAQLHGCAMVVVCLPGNSRKATPTSAFLARAFRLRSLLDVSHP